MELYELANCLNNEIRVKGYPDRIGIVTGISVYDFDRPKAAVIERIDVRWQTDWSNWEEGRSKIAPVNGQTATSGFGWNGRHVSYFRSKACDITKVLAVLELVPVEPG